MNVGWNVYNTLVMVQGKVREMVLDSLEEGLGHIHSMSAYISYCVGPVMIIIQTSSIL